MHAVTLTDRAVRGREIRFADGRTSSLPPLVATLLHTFAAHPGVVLSASWLAGAVWVGGVSEATVRNTVALLRREIEVAPRTPAHLHTVRGDGWRFTPPPPAPGAWVRPVQAVGIDATVTAVQRALDGHALVSVVGPPGAGTTTVAIAALRGRRALCLRATESASNLSEHLRMLLHAPSTTARGLAYTAVAAGCDVLLVDGLVQHGAAAFLAELAGEHSELRVLTAGWVGAGGTDVLVPPLAPSDAAALLADAIRGSGGHPPPESDGLIRLATAVGCRPAPLTWLAGYLVGVAPEAVRERLVLGRLAGPARLRDQLSARLAQVTSDTERAALSCLSVFPDAFRPEHAAELGVPTEVVRGLAERHLLERLDAGQLWVPRTVRWVWPPSTDTQQAHAKWVARQLTPAFLRNVDHVNPKVSGRLSALAPSIEVALRFAQGAQDGPLAVALLAGVAALPARPETGAALLERVDAVGRLELGTARGEWLRIRSGALLTDRQFAESLAAADLALALHPDPSTRIELLALASVAARKCGRTTPHQPMIDTLLRTPPSDVDPTPLGWLWLRRADACRSLGDNTGYAEGGRRGRALFEQTHCVRGIAAALRCEADAAPVSIRRRRVAQVVALLESSGHTMWLATELGMLISACTESGDWAGAERAAARWREHHKRLGWDYSGYAAAAEGNLAMARGRWQEATDHLDDAAATAARLGTIRLTALVLGIRGEMALERGQLDRAEALLIEAQATFEATGEPQYARRIRQYRGEVRAERGDITGACDDLADADLPHYQLARAVLTGPHAPPLLSAEQGRALVDQLWAEEERLLHARALVWLARLVRASGGRAEPIYAEAGAASAALQLPADGWVLRSVHFDTSARI